MYCVAAAAAAVAALLLGYKEEFTMAPSVIGLDVGNFGSTGPLFSESFPVAKTRYTLTRKGETARRQWNKERATFRLKRQVELDGTGRPRRIQSQVDLAASSLLPL
jgi:hypothetical protein